MGFHVVDADEGQSPHQGVGLGRADPDEQRAHQAGADGGRHRRQLGAGDAGFGQGLVDDRPDQLEMGPAGQFGDDATEAGVEVDLAAHDRGEDPTAVLDDGGRRLVA